MCCFLLVDVGMAAGIRTLLLLLFDLHAILWLRWVQDSELGSCGSGRRRHRKIRKAAV